MSLRMPTFVCKQNHWFEQVVDATVTEVRCMCGAQAESKPYRPGDRMNVKSAERLSKDEVRQYLTQFGDWDKEKKKWKFIPSNKDELNVALKQEGKVAISAKEFDAMLERKKPEPPAATIQQKAEMVDVIKARREQFRSHYDSGMIPKSETSTDVAQAAVAEVKGE